jgi:hypothetical protein
MNTLVTPPVVVPPAGDTVTPPAGDQGNDNQDVTPPAGGQGNDQNNGQGSNDTTVPPAGNTVTPPTDEGAMDGEEVIISDEQVAPVVANSIDPRPVVVFEKEPNAVIADGTNIVLGKVTVTAKGGDIKINQLPLFIRGYNTAGVSNLALYTPSGTKLPVISSAPVYAGSGESRIYVFNTQKYEIKKDSSVDFVVKANLKTTGTYVWMDISLANDAKQFKYFKWTDLKSNKNLIGLPLLETISDLNPESPLKTYRYLKPEALSIARPIISFTDPVTRLENGTAKKLARMNINAVGGDVKLGWIKLFTKTNGSVKLANLVIKDVKNKSIITSMVISESVLDGGVRTYNITIPSYLISNGSSIDFDVYFDVVGVSTGDSVYIGMPSLSQLQWLYGWTDVKAKNNYNAQGKGNTNPVAGVNPEEYPTSVVVVSAASSESSMTVLANPILIDVFNRGFYTPLVLTSAMQLYSAKAVGYSSNYTITMDGKGLSSAATYGAVRGYCYLSEIGQSGGYLNFDVKELKYDTVTKKLVATSNQDFKKTFKPEAKCYIKVIGQNGESNEALVDTSAISYSDINQPFVYTTWNDDLTYGNYYLYTVGGTKDLLGYAMMQPNDKNKETKILSVEFDAIVTNPVNSKVSPINKLYLTSKTNGLLATVSAVAVNNKIRFDGLNITLRPGIQEQFKIDADYAKPTTFVSFNSKVSYYKYQIGNENPIEVFNPSSPFNAQTIVSVINSIPVISIAKDSDVPLADGNAQNIASVSIKAEGGDMTIQQLPVYIKTNGVRITNLYLYDSKGLIKTTVTPAVKTLSTEPGSGEYIVTLPNYKILAGTTAKFYVKTDISNKMTGASIETYLDSVNNKYFKNKLKWTDVKTAKSHTGDIVNDRKGRYPVNGVIISALNTSGNSDLGSVIVSDSAVMQLLTALLGN